MASNRCAENHIVIVNLGCQYNITCQVMLSSCNSIKTACPSEWMQKHMLQSFVYLHPWKQQLCVSDSWHHVCCSTGRCRLHEHRAQLWLLKLHGVLQQFWRGLLICMGSFLFFLGLSTAAWIKCLHALFLFFCAVSAEFTWQLVPSNFGGCASPHARVSYMYFLGWEMVCIVGMCRFDESVSVWGGCMDDVGCLMLRRVCFLHRFMLSHVLFCLDQGCFLTCQWLYGGCWSCLPQLSCRGFVSSLDLPRDDSWYWFLGCLEGFLVLLSDWNSYEMIVCTDSSDFQRKLAVAVHLHLIEMPVSDDYSAREYTVSALDNASCLTNSQHCTALM